MYEEYITTHHRNELIKILTGASEETRHLALNINFVKLFENDPNLGNMILKDPEKALEELDKALVSIQKILVSELNCSEILEKNVHVRIYGLPSCHDQHRTLIPQSVDLNLFLQITGSVVRTTLVKMLEFRRSYICAKCKYEMIVNADYEHKYVIFAPKTCSNPEGCNGTNISALNTLNVSNCKDFQEIKIQEQIADSSLGNMPSSIWVTLEDDLVDTCKPGDNVTICGTVKRRWGPLYINKKIAVELVIKANHLQINNSESSTTLVTPEIKDFFHSFWKKYRNQPFIGRDIILNSICPQLYGLHTVKLATALVLASGSRKQENGETGVRARSESHLLLVGDPGTGKSQILKFAAKIIPRSVLTTGVGSTSAGLTVTAIQENGEWQLEGGALVLADGGICCIDEFNSMKEHDRTSIHEAMEQQTISVAKASIVCKLNTRCSILAAINPKGHFDPQQPLTVNVGLPSPLLSRFDIILILQDTKDTEWDNVICDHILNRINLDEKNENSQWSIDRLRAYFSYVKEIHPNLTPEANRILSSYYQIQRKSFMTNRVTVRLLDSLVRLSLAHARLMFHEEVQVMDAITAVIAIECSMHGAFLNLDVNSLHSPFPKDPMQSYSQLVRSILEKLELRDILYDELVHLKKMEDQLPGVEGSNELFKKLDKNYEMAKGNFGCAGFFGKEVKKEKENNQIEDMNHLEVDLVEKETEKEKQYTEKNSEIDKEEQKSKQNHSRDVFSSVLPDNYEEVNFEEKSTNNSPETATTSKKVFKEEKNTKNSPKTASTSKKVFQEGKNTNNSPETATTSKKVLKNEKNTNNSPETASTSKKVFKFKAKNVLAEKPSNLFNTNVQETNKNIFEESNDTEKAKNDLKTTTNISDSTTSKIDLNIFKFVKREPKKDPVVSQGLSVFDNNEMLEEKSIKKFVSVIENVNQVETITSENSLLFTIEQKNKKRKLNDDFRSEIDKDRFNDENQLLGDKSQLNVDKNVTKVSQNNSKWLFGDESDLDCEL